MISRVPATIAVAILICNVTPLSAQETERRAPAQPSTDLRPDSPPPLPGERVRFLAPAIVTGTQCGTFRGVERGDLIIDPHNGTLTRWAIPLRDLERLEARRGTGKGGARKGAIIGMVAGGLIFGLGGYLSAGGSSNEYAGIVPLVLTPVGIGAGAVTGALVGRGTDRRWVTVTIPERGGPQNR